jgi:hypothetical protein
MEKYTEKEKKEMMKQYELHNSITANDIYQSILTENGILPNPNKFAKEFFKDKVKNKMLICPFCLTPQYLSQFSFDRGYYKCPKCKSRTTEKTLSLMFDIFNFPKINIDEFAKWVFGYRVNGFFQKVNFQEWNKKLHDLGVSYDFWDYYKKLKGEYQIEKQKEKEE